MGIVYARREGDPLFGAVGDIASKKGGGRVAFTTWRGMGKEGMGELTSGLARFFCSSVHLVSKSNGLIDCTNTFCASLL